MRFGVDSEQGRSVGYARLYVQQSIPQRASLQLADNGLESLAALRVSGGGVVQQEIGVVDEGGTRQNSGLSRARAERAQRSPPENANIFGDFGVGQLGVVAPPQLRRFAGINSGVAADDPRKINEIDVLMAGFDILEQYADRLHQDRYSSPLPARSHKFDVQSGFFGHLSDGRFFGQFAGVDMAARGQPGLDFIVP